MSHNTSRQPRFAGLPAPALVVLSVLFSLGMVLTADAHADGVRLGAKAAVNFGWFSGSDWDDFLDFLRSDPDITNVSNDTRIGFIGGVFAEVPLGPALAFQPELLIGSIGGALSFRDQFFGDSVEITQRATVLKLPLLLKPKLPVAEHRSVYALLGPAPAVLLGDVKARVRANGFSDEASAAPDNRFVFSATVGAGYEHRFDAGAINLELRYNRTFSDIFDGDNTRINSINIFAGWGFDL